jgi:hypothetical protein
MVTQQIVLIEPADGAQTPPLQQFHWPLEHASEDNAAALPIIWDALTQVTPDRTMPRPVTFAWEAVPTASQYELLLATEPNFANARQITGLAAPRAEVRHLHLDTQYYWKVLAKRDSRLLAASPTRTVTTHQAPPRWIHVPGITNVRDLGGWLLQGGGCIRQGMIYHTSEMNRHLHITEEGKRILLDDLHIRTDLDLREDGIACPALDAARVQWVNIPIMPYTTICEDTPIGKPAYRRIFSLLADPEVYPLVFHCWGGADRVGTVAFLLGALLGMSLQDLIRDYELTSLSIWGPRSHTSAEFAGLLTALRPFSDDPQNISEQVEHYLRWIGVTQREMERIREQLIER